MKLLAILANFALYERLELASNGHQVTVYVSISCNDSLGVVVLKVLAPMLDHETHLVKVFDARALRHFHSETSFDQVLHTLGAVFPVVFAEIEC